MKLEELRAQARNGFGSVAAVSEVEPYDVWFRREDQSIQEQIWERIWLEYYVKCEIFDRSLPGHWMRVDEAGREWIISPEHRHKGAQYSQKMMERVKALIGANNEASHGIRTRVSLLSFAHAHEELEWHRHCGLHKSVDLLDGSP